MSRIFAKNLVATFWAVAVLFAGPESQAEGSLTVSIAAPGYWCPYACEANGSRSGFTVDIARAALESEGYEVVYTNQPYDRALHEAKIGRVDAVVPAFKREARNFIFPSSSVSQTEFCFYVPEHKSLRYTGLESLKNIRFVATSGYSYGEAMDAYISDNRDGRVTLIGGSDVSNRLRELVKKKRYDALLDDRLLFAFSQNHLGLVNAGCLDEGHAGYLAFSPEDPDRSNKIAQAFDRGFKTIRENGQLCQILRKYGLGAEFVPGLSSEYCPPG